MTHAVVAEALNIVSGVWLHDQVCDGSGAEWFGLNNSGQNGRGRQGRKEPASGLQSLLFCGPKP